jgi:hypothetical protein
MSGNRLTVSWGASVRLNNPENHPPRLLVEEVAQADNKNAAAQIVSMLRVFIRFNSLVVKSGLAEVLKRL